MVKIEKIGIVVQRYGVEVNGGAEFHARMLAEKLSQNYNIDILTTTALDYINGWKNHYPEGETRVNGIKVFRFKTFQMLGNTKMRKVRRTVMKRKKYFKILRFLGLFDFFERHFHITKITSEDINAWLVGQGPYCPDLVTYIDENRDNYDVFIFFTYLYYPTVKAMPLVGQKSIFIPTVHDEPPLYSEVYKKIFSVPKFIMYNTFSEKQLVESLFENVCENTDVAGIGVEEYSLQDYEPTKQVRFQMPYFVYVGRIEINKGCKTLIEYFEKFSKKYPNIALVMVGKNFMDITPSKNIFLTGFVSEQDKYYLLKNSLGLIIPSRYESLSLVTLETLVCGKIPIVNGNCEVLKNHIEQSKVGFCFKDYQSFEDSLCKVMILSESEKQDFSSKAISYVKNNYTWERVLTKFDQAIRFIKQKQKLS